MTFATTAYPSATFKNPQGVFDAGGGTVHLWLALVAAAVACFVGPLPISVSVGHNEADEIHINS